MSERKTYFVVVEAKIPVTVAVQASSEDEAMQIGEKRAQAIIERNMKPTTRKEAYKYEAVQATEAKPPEDAPA